jgi:hypothetical protein
MGTKPNPLHGGCPMLNWSAAKPTIVSTHNQPSGVRDIKPIGTLRIIQAPLVELGLARGS